MAPIIDHIKVTGDIRSLTVAVCVEVFTGGKEHLETSLAPSFCLKRHAVAFSSYIYVLAWT